MTPIRRMGVQYGAVDRGDGAGVTIGRGFTVACGLSAKALVVVDAAGRRHFIRIGPFIGAGSLVSAV